MNVFVLPCLSSVIIKRLNLSFHLKNRKVNGCSKGKALHHSFSHLKETGIKKFLTIRNPLPDLRQEKAGKARTADYRLNFNILPINRGSRAIFCFTYSFILLSGYAIKWEFDSYLPIKILLHTISIFLHTR